MVAVTVVTPDAPAGPAVATTPVTVASDPASTAAPPTSTQNLAR